MTAPAQPYGPFAAPPSPLRGGIVTFALGLLVTVGLVVYAIWLAIAPVATEDAIKNSSVEHPAVAPLGAAALASPTPSGATLAFDQLWISGNGDTVVVGAPTVGISALTGEPMIQVPVTLTNNGETDWSPEPTGFIGTLNHAPVPESSEGDLMYRSPIVPHTSVTLNKVFVGHPGQFTLKVNTPHGVAAFAGQI